METIIRPARLADAESLQRECYPEARLEDVRDYLAWCLRQAGKGRLTRLVAEVQGLAVGNAQLTIWGSVGEIGSLVVGEAFRRQGLARRLIEALIVEAQQRGLEAVEIGVDPQQPGVRLFYESLGFRRVQQKSGLPQPTCSEPAVHLCLWLSRS